MGKPKAWLPFAGELMLHRVVRILSGVVNPIVVVAAPEQEVPPLPEKITLLRDKVKGKGPLQGLAMGLEWLQGKAEAAYVSSCDVPFLRPAFMLRMVDLLGDHKICVPKIGDYHHPLAAVYRTEIIPVVERLIAEDRLRPFYLFQEVPTRIVEACE